MNRHVMGFFDFPAPGGRHASEAYRRDRSLDGQGKRIAKAKAKRVERRAKRLANKAVRS